MVLRMETKELIRRLVMIDGLSQREVCRRFGWSRDAIADAILNPEPNTYTLQAPRPRPVTDPVIPLVQQWLQEDKSKPRKQRHTRTRIFERLRDEYDFQGSRRAISDLINSLQDKPADVFCPIDHPPGAEVQIDWGEATVILNGIQTKVMIFCARSAYSKASFVRAYQRAIDTCCANHAFHETAVLLAIQDIQSAPPAPALDVSFHPLLQQTESGTRSLACYDSLIFADHPGQECQELSDPAVNEPVLSSHGKECNQ